MRTNAKPSWKRAVSAAFPDALEVQKVFAIMKETTNSKRVTFQIEK